MIDLLSLQHFLVVARTQSLAQAAEQLHLTPSALSKSLKRLEQSLQTTLFDREGRSLQLNMAGQQLEMRAAALLHNAEQLKSEFIGERQAFNCRVVGPHILQLSWGVHLADRLQTRYPSVVMRFHAKDDLASIAAVEAGEYDCAIVAIPESGVQSAAVDIIHLGETEYRVAYSPYHTIAKDKQFKNGTIHVRDLLTYDFVAPITPGFSSLQNQAATDGWRDDVFPRTIRYRTDDLLMIRELVASGRALAYLPDYVIDKLGLTVLKVSACPYFCRQQIALVYRPSDMKGWLSYIVDAAKNRFIEN